MHRICFGLVIWSVLQFAQDSRAQIQQYFPDNTNTVVRIDVKKTLNSPAIKKLLEGQSFLQYVAKFGEHFRPGLNAQVTEESLVTLVKNFVPITETVTIPLVSDLFGPFNSPPLVLLEGKYNTETLILNVSKMCRANRMPFRLEASGRYDVISVGEKENPTYLSVINGTLLVIANRELLNQTLFRASNRAVSNLNEKMANALKKQPVAPISITHVDKFNEQSITTFSLNLNSKYHLIHELTSYLPNEEEAVKAELKFKDFLKYVPKIETLPEVEKPLTRAVSNSIIKRDGTKLTYTYILLTQDFISSLLNTESSRITPLASAAFVLDGYPKGHIVRDLALTPDGKYITATSGRKGGGLLSPKDEKTIPGGVTLWDWGTKQIVLQKAFDTLGEKDGYGGNNISIHNSVPVFAVSRSSNAWYSDEVDVWNFHNKKQIIVLKKEDHPTFQPGKGFYFATRHIVPFIKSEIRLRSLFSIAFENPLSTIPLSIPCEQFAFSPSGRYLAVRFRSQKDSKGQITPVRIEIWEIIPGETPAFGVSAKQVATVRFGNIEYAGKFVWSATDSSFALVCPKDNTVRIWDWNQNQEIRSLSIGGKNNQVGNLVFSPDGSYLAVAMEREGIKVIHLETGKSRTVRSSATNYYNTPMIFTPDGQYILVGSGDKIYACRTN